MEKMKEHLPEKKKDTLIINYDVMLAGGVETHFASLMKACIAKGYRVIWITSELFLKQVAFDGLVDNPGLEIIVTRSRLHFLDIPKISLAEDERVIMFTCEPLAYMVSEKIRMEAGTKKFLHYLAVPHFTGKSVFPDRYPKSKPMQKLIYHYLRRILGRTAASNCILGFAPKHLETYESYYQIPLAEKTKQVIPGYDMVFSSFDKENTKARCVERNEKFVITSCSRFEFPHKAYLLGLVDAFAKVKEKYPQVVLQLVGYGSGQQELENRIMALPESVRRDIHMLGMLSPEALEQCYKNSQLVVGLAGAVITGARCGIPSLIARHYNYDCETYGFFGDVPEKTLCEEEGMDIVPFIEDCINMDMETYLQHVEKAARVMEQHRNTEIPSLEDRFASTEKTCPKFVRNSLEMLIAKVLYVVCCVLRRKER